MWERHELLFVIKNEPFKRNKAALALFWDLNARNHEVTFLKIKHIRLREKYDKAIFLTKPKLVLDLFSYIENVTFKFHNLFDPRDKDGYETWRATIKLWHQSKARAKGVSNYMIRELNELLDKSDIIPAVNQVEFHPWANAHRIEVEEEKPDKERGNYIHPDLYSQQKRIE